MGVEISGIVISANEADAFRRMTGKKDPSEAVAGVLTLIGKLRGSPEWQEARERALANYQPSPEVLKKILSATAALDARRRLRRKIIHQAIPRRR